MKSPFQMYTFALWLAQCSTLYGMCNAKCMMRKRPFQTNSYENLLVNCEWHSLYSLDALNTPLITTAQRHSSQFTVHSFATKLSYIMLYFDALNALCLMAYGVWQIHIHDSRRHIPCASIIRLHVLLYSILNSIRDWIIAMLVFFFVCWYIPICWANTETLVVVDVKYNGKNIQNNKAKRKKTFRKIEN